MCEKSRSAWSNDVSSDRLEQIVNPSTKAPLGEEDRRVVGHGVVACLDKE